MCAARLILRLCGTEEPLGPLFQERYLGYVAAACPALVPAASRSSLFGPGFPELLPTSEVLVKEVLSAQHAVANLHSAVMQTQMVVGAQCVPKPRQRVGGARPAQ